MDKESELVWLDRDSADLLEAGLPMQIFCHKVDSFHCLLNALKLPALMVEFSDFGVWDCAAA